MSANQTIPPLYPREYDLNYRLLAQQTESITSPFVNWTSFEGRSEDIQLVGQADFQSITARARETVITETPFSKRRLSKSPYDKADLFDEFDDAFLGKLSGYKSKLQVAHVAGWNRLQDVVAIASALGNAQVPTVDAFGVDSVTLQALPTAQKVLINYVETGSAANSSLTIGKIRRAKEILDDSDADDTLGRVMLITANELQALLRFTEVTNSDYANVKALVDGKVDTFLGFKFKRVSSTKVLPAASGVRNLPAWIEGAISMSKTGPRSSMAIRYDRSEALQVRHSGLVGGVREQDNMVVQIAVDSTIV